jgi:hypothetical protein
MSSLDKLQRDYQGFVENVERTAAADVMKIREDLSALKAKASEFHKTV